MAGLLIQLVEGSPPVLHVGGELDLATGDELRAALMEALATAPTTVLDMAEVTFVDASGLRVILQVAESLDGAGPLTLVNASGAARLLELVGLSSIPCLDMRNGSDDRDS